MSQPPRKIGPVDATNQGQADLMSRIDVVSHPPQADNNENGRKLVAPAVMTSSERSQLRGSALALARAELQSLWAGVDHHVAPISDLTGEQFSAYRSFQFALEHAAQWPST